jgi:hypothetical protein
MLAATLSCVAFAVDASGEQTRVESVAPEPPPVPDTFDVERPVDREKEEALLRDLFELQMQISRTHDHAERDSLQTEYEDLLRQVNALSTRRPASRRQREERLQRAEELIDELSREFQGSDVDWEEVSRAFDAGMKEFGAGLEQLGEILQGVEVNIEGDQFEFDDGQGSRITVPLKLPPEVHKRVAEGLQEFMDALDESTGQGFMAEIRKIVPPDVVGQLPGWDSRRERKRRVVAQSVFRFTEGFDLAEDEVVQGDVVVIGAPCTIAGEVQGNAYVLLGDLYVEDTGSIGKDAVSLGGDVVQDGSVRGKMFDMGNIAPGFLAGPWTGLGGGMAIPMHGIRVAVLALLLIMAFALVGDRLGLVADHTASFPLRNLGWGSLYLLVAVGGFAVVSLGLAITVIGIPVAIVLAVAFVGLLLGAYFIACEVLGTRLLTMMGGEKPRAMWVAGLVGLAILEIPSFLAASMPQTVGAGAALPLQILDYLLKFTALSIGLGSIMATRFGSRPRERARVLPLTVDDASHNPT